ncbi:MAG: hypothetical protein K1X53_02695 [Candidatus Sumerlaeaceae bacterium]|nr:hypothetical protein [Candidatus Sumerlaeaceae bacterium]
MPEPPVGDNPAEPRVAEASPADTTVSLRNLAWGLITGLVLLLFFLEPSGPVAALIAVSIGLCILTPEWERSSKKDWEWQHYDPAQGRRSASWFRRLLIYESGCIGTALLFVAFGKLMEYNAVPQNQAYWHRFASNSIINTIGGALCVLSCGCLIRLVELTYARFSQRKPQHPGTSGD